MQEITRDSHILVAWRFETDSEFAYGVVIVLSFPARRFFYSLNAVLSGGWLAAPQKDQASSQPSAWTHS
jgi:hypothetical protein